MHIYPKQAITQASSDDTGAKTFYKVSFWDDGVGTAHTFDQGRVIVHSDHVEVKIHESAIDDAPVPADLTGYECFVSVDADLDKVYGQETVQAVDKRGRHRIYKFPRETAITPQIP